MAESISTVDTKMGRRPRMSRLLPQDFFPKTFSQSPRKRRPLETPNPNHLNEQPKRQSHELQICPCTEEPKMGGAKAVRSVRQLEERYCIDQQSPQRENPRVMRHLSSYEALLQRKLKIRCFPEQEAVARINQYRITKRESRSEHSHHKGSKGALQDGKHERRRVLVSTIFLNSDGPCELIPREGKEIRMSLGFDGMLTFRGDLKKSN